MIALFEHIPNPEQVNTRWFNTALGFNAIFAFTKSIRPIRPNSFKQRALGSNSPIPVVQLPYLTLTEEPLHTVTNIDQVTRRNNLQWRFVRRKALSWLQQIYSVVQHAKTPITQANVKIATNSPIHVRNLLLADKIALRSPWDRSQNTAPWISWSHNGRENIRTNSKLKQTQELYETTLPCW